MSVRRTGDWNRARRMLGPGAGRRLRATIKRTVRREAQRLRKDIVVGIRKQAPGGERFRPLSRLTLAARRMADRGGSKALIVSGDLRNSIAVKARGDAAFVGVPRSARSEDGDQLVNIARVHEFGSEPIIIPITPAMRRFLGALFKRVGRSRHGRGGGAGVVVTQIPARPYLRPAAEEWKRGLRERVQAEIRTAMRWR